MRIDFTDDRKAICPNCEKINTLYWHDERNQYEFNCECGKSYSIHISKEDFENIFDDED
jgi:hypothetical protein